MLAILLVLFLAVLTLLQFLNFGALEETSKTMSEIQDAVQAIKDDQARIAAAVAHVLELLQQPNPDVAAAVTALKEVDAGFDASAEALESAGTEPPVV